MNQAIVLSITNRLASQYQGVFSAQTIEQLVSRSAEQLERHAQITTFLQIFVERFARERLEACAKAQGGLVPDKPEVLFVCVHNAGRSVAASVLLSHHGNGQVVVRSAGSTPGSEVNAAVIQALAERGLDASQEFPKPLTDEFARAADVIVTMGCGDACPVFPGKRYLDWQLDDPAGKPIEEVRPIVDEIDRRVHELLGELVSAGSRP